MSEKKSCFVIMPIRTPPHMREKYRDADDHFTHVLECLFIPGIEKADYTPVSPIAKGADLIHAEIVRNLEMSDLVLCDMSCLNPNVFFEFGIRTSLNKPVCVVKDEHTKQVPFDTGILNYQEYDSSLDPWSLKGDIEKLGNHVRTSAERSKGQNTLWRYFGVKSEAKSYEGEKGADAKLDYLSLQIDSLKEKIDSFREQQAVHEGARGPRHIDIGSALHHVVSLLSRDVTFNRAEVAGESGPIYLYYSGDLSLARKKQILSDVIMDFGVEVFFLQTPPAGKGAKEVDGDI